jgi:hypothetical protein
MPGLWRELYGRLWETPVLDSNAVHDALYTF